MDLPSLHLVFYFSQTLVLLLIRVQALEVFLSVNDTEPSVSFPAFPLAFANDSYSLRKAPAYLLSHDEQQQCRIDGSTSH